ncbi:MAG: hypothetical protein OEW11_04065 [Nitrospirota bacterium]|nr:hypothetical protein [Nitrospirota bacterium]
MTGATLGMLRREMGRMLSGSGMILALPVGMAWMAWQRYYSSGDLGAADTLDGVFRAAGVVLGVLAVWLASPSLSAERAEGTASLWATSPVRPSQVVTGKLLAVLLFLLGAALLLLAPPLWHISLAEPLTWGRLLSGMLGLFLLSLLAASVTLLASALVRHFSTAFCWGLAALVVWIWGDQVLVRVTGILSSLTPASWGVISPEMGTSAGWGGKDLLLPMFVGWVDAGAVCIMLVAAATLLLVAHQVVASERWRS